MNVHSINVRGGDAHGKSATSSQASSEVVFEVNKSTKLCITMKGKKVYIDRKIPRG